MREKRKEARGNGHMGREIQESVAINKKNKKGRQGGKSGK